MFFYFSFLSILLIIINQNLCVASFVNNFTSLETGGIKKEYQEHSITRRNTDETRSPSPEDNAFELEIKSIISLSTEKLKNIKEDEIKVMTNPILENIYWASLDNTIKFDHARKAALCRIAAIGDYPPAVTEYANMLFAGRGVPQNKREALNYYLKAVDKKNEGSITFLFRLLKEETLFTDFNVLSSEQDAIRRQVQEAYSELERYWEEEF